MCVWMNPGSTNAPAASIVVSIGASGLEPPTLAMRPSRTRTSPGTTSIASFIVRIVAFLMRRDTQCRLANDAAEDAAESREEARHRIGRPMQVAVVARLGAGQERFGDDDWTHRRGQLAVPFVDLDK